MSERIWLQEIQERLEYVMKTKEKAVQETINNTEAALAKIGELRALVSMHHEDQKEQMMSGINFFQMAQDFTGKVQHQLTETLMAQGYQDLTGQVLKQLMLEINTYCEEGKIIKNDDEKQGMGPGVTAGEKAGRIDDQSDVDDLLNNLGI